MSLSFTETAWMSTLLFSEVFKLCKNENLNFTVYSSRHRQIDKHSYKQVHFKVEPTCKSLFLECLNSWDQLHFILSKGIF